MSRVWYLKSILLLLAIFSFAMHTKLVNAQGELAGVEKFVPPGWEVNDKVQGDVTGDRLDDLVLALKNKGNPDAPGMLLVLRRKSDGSFEQIGSNNALLLCDNCLGMVGDIKISINRKGVLIVDQLAGSRVTREGIWRFRFDPRDGKMELIGLDIEYNDRADGSGTKESTNYLTGKRITESYAFSSLKDKSVLTKSKTGSVATTKIFLEQVTSKSLQ